VCMDKLELLDSVVELGPTDDNGDRATARRFCGALEGGFHTQCPQNASACRACWRTST